MTQHYLATPLRRALEKTIKEARIVAETGASDAIRRLGIAEGKAPTYLSEEEKELRRRLRAHARTLGDRFDRDSDEQEVNRLIEAAAYAHWHRMLFARFLAERGLLRHPEHNVSVTLEDCREIAQEEGAADAWTVAERYAASMLPAVFRIDDPVLSMTLDAAQSQSMHRLVTELDDHVFQAEDSLGWTYQFWRAAEKDAVNKKGDKIGADQISAVTQLFTEPYMVRFLLHNTLGAWWAGKILAANTDLAKTAANEDVLRATCNLPRYTFDMLRFVREGEGDEARWRPAAGTFQGWPKEAKEITMLDPCCGSGHFLTEALTILVTLREAEENLSPADAVAAVLRDNLHGLEIDGRCVQIAAFAVALTAWRIGGWQTLPLPHIAWVGAPPPLPKAEFSALADGDEELQRALLALHDLFARAPILGSLLDPTGGDLVDPVRIARVEHLLEPLLAKARRAEPERAEGAIAARGMVEATAILSQKFVLQATNVPFLGKAKQDPQIVRYIEKRFESAKSDLATAMLARMFSISRQHGTVAAVSPQNWWYLGTYRNFRRDLLGSYSVNFLAELGSNSFSTPMWFFNIGLSICSKEYPKEDLAFCGVSAADESSADQKYTRLLDGLINGVSQKSLAQLSDSPLRIKGQTALGLLGEYAESLQGITTGDDGKWRRTFWETWDLLEGWHFFQMPSKGLGEYSGRSHVIRSGLINGSEHTGAIRGRDAWGKSGIAIDRVGSLAASFYDGDYFHSLVPAIIPKNPSNLPALACFLFSDEFVRTTRETNPSLSVDNGYLKTVPFDLDHWKEEAHAKYPSGLPEPYSDDPTQWLFHGHPAKAARGVAVHVALARLCGYRWPAETDRKMRLSAEAREWIARAAVLPDGDQDGLLAVAGVAGEKPLADRLRTYLARAFGVEWSDALERRLVADADEVLDKKQVKDGSLEGWLRDRAFRQHCVLFDQRPFLWHIWDGLKDGFSVFVHYHRFTQANLQKLTYTMLGDWLRRAKDENNDLRYEKGRELQQMLEKVLEGEAPYDIFVRWKPMVEQPLGWDPDLDDGARMNIRPFMEAGILREQPKGIKWTKDRGNDVPSAPWYPVFKGERINDHHTTLEEKRAARAGNPQMVAAK